MQTRNYKEIEGIRTIFNFWVVLLHTYNILLYYQSSPYGSFDEFNSLKSAPWIGAVKGFTIQVDIFFMISGFMTTEQVLNGLFSSKEAYPNSIDIAINNENKIRVNSYEQMKFIIFIGLKKLLRYMPGALVCGLVSYLFADVYESLSGIIWDTMTMKLQSGLSPVSLIVTWSNRVDFIGTTIIAALTSIIVSIRCTLKWKKTMILILALLALIPTLIIQLRNHQYSVPVLTSFRATHIPMHFSYERSQWISKRFGLDNMPYFEDKIGWFSEYMQYFYVSWWSRHGFVHSSLDSTLPSI